MWRLQIAGEIDWRGIEYTGVDVVPALIEHHRGKFAGAGIDFMLAPSNHASLPDAELLICKDVLQHLPDRTVCEFLDQIAPRYPLVLVINDAPPEGRERNYDIAPGDWRWLDIREPPSSQAAVVVKELRMPRGDLRPGRLGGKLNSAVKLVMLLTH